MAVTVVQTNVHELYNANRTNTLTFTYGGFLRCETCSSILISSSVFTNIASANLGGVLYVKMLDANKLS